MITRITWMCVPCLFVLGTVEGRTAAPAAPRTHPVVIDVRHDLTTLGISQANVPGTGLTDDTPLFQAAVDYAAERGGGSVLAPPGLYRIQTLEVKPGVRLIGSGVDRTVFRAWGSGEMFQMAGGALHDLTAYGTKGPEVSGKNWHAVNKGEGRRGTGSALMIVSIRNATAPVTLHNVHAYEARFDCLYVRTADGLYVYNCRFDRAGRNVISLVGETRNFLFANCYFGSLWGLYHFDVEPNRGRSVHDGMFLHCVFDGRDAGKQKTGTWGRMLILNGHPEQRTGNFTLLGCTFHRITIRVQRTFPGLRMLYCRMDAPGRAFISVRTKPAGFLRDAVVRGNHFTSDGQPLKNLSYGVTFTGASVLEGNVPESANARPAGRPRPEPPGESGRAKPPGGGRKVEIREAKGPHGAVVSVTMPLMGHEFRFADRKVAPRRTGAAMDLSLHVDPIHALGRARLRLLGAGRLEDFPRPAAGDNTRVLWGARRGQILAVKTNEGKTALLEIVRIAKTTIAFRYRILD